MASRKQDTDWQELSAFREDKKNREIARLNAIIQNERHQAHLNVAALESQLAIQRAEYEAQLDLMKSEVSKRQKWIDLTMGFIEQSLANKSA